MDIFDFSRVSCLFSLCFNSWIVDLGAPDIFFLGKKYTGNCLFPQFELHFHESLLIGFDIALSLAALNYDEFYDSFSSLVWITYRKDFEPLSLTCSLTRYYHSSSYLILLPYLMHQHRDHHCYHSTAMLDGAACYVVPKCCSLQHSKSVIWKMVSGCHRQDEQYIFTIERLFAILY